MARSDWFIRVVSSDLRDTRFGLESTRLKRFLSLPSVSPLSETESSQSDPSSSSSSSSSLALSGASSSSSDSKTSSSASDRWLMVRKSTSSRKEVCFFEFKGRLRPAVSEL